MESDCPLVLIKWEDSRQPSCGWQFLSDLSNPDTLQCATVGWLLEDGPEKKVIAQTIGGGEDDVQATGVMVIPARSVILIERLEEASSASSQDETSSCRLSASEQKQKLCAAASV